MTEVFTRQRINVAQGADTVRWTIGSHAVRLYYPTCIKIAAGIRVAAKAAMPHEGANVGLWRELAKYQLEQPWPLVHHEYRRSGVSSNVKNWRVDVVGSLVVVVLNELEAGFHYSDAFVMQAWLDVAARRAKAWAGDDSNAFVLTARLTALEA